MLLAYHKVEAKTEGSIPLFDNIATMVNMVARIGASKLKMYKVLLAGRVVGVVVVVLLLVVVVVGMLLKLLLELLLELLELVYWIVNPVLVVVFVSPVVSFTLTMT